MDDPLLKNLLTMNLTGSTKYLIARMKPNCKGNKYLNQYISFTSRNSDNTQSEWGFSLQSKTGLKVFFS